MQIEDVKARIQRFLASEKGWPIVVDFQTKDDLESVIDHFRIGENQFVSAEAYCGADEPFKLEEFYDALRWNVGDTFITGLSTFLKLRGEADLRKVLRTALTSYIQGHVVILTYQCKNFLKFPDEKIRDTGRVVIADGEPDIAADICLVSPELASAFPGCYTGFEKVGHAVETNKSGIVYIATAIPKSTFAKPILTITQMDSGYDILCARDSRTKTVPESFASPNQWNYALMIMGSHGSWASVAASEFGAIESLPKKIVDYKSFSANKQWLYYILLSLLGTNGNAYLQTALFNAANYTEMIRSVYRALLTVDHEEPTFKKLYEERKTILQNMPDPLADTVDYCKVVSVKEKDAIYYLTDLTQPEKEKVIEWLDKYGAAYNASELASILRDIYPDLGLYLSNFQFKNPLLNSYFEAYKYQKLINRVLPSFEQVVDEQSTQFDFQKILRARSTVVDKLDVTNAHAYFFDALGVEYLGFIQEKCRAYGLSVSITCARCELPSLTCFNKEFVETFEARGCKVSDIKELDDIKHHGENSFDYEKTKTPLYLIRELEIIDELLKKIRANLQSGYYSKEIIVSDHGASRLAVLHDTENLWRMETNGVHSGRCCPKNDINEKPDFSVESEGFWVLANYDRFQGSRKANVEVHGGATLEEVAVPIIEITLKQAHMEAFIVDASRVLELGAKECATLKIYAGVKSHNVSVRLNDSYYDAEPTTEDYIYLAKLEDLTKKGEYTVDILLGNDVIAENQRFEIKKKGMTEIDLFDF